MLAGRRALRGLMAGGRKSRNAATAFATAAAALDKETAQTDDTYGSTSQGIVGRRDEVCSSLRGEYSNSGTFGPSLSEWA